MDPTMAWLFSTDPSQEVIPGEENITSALFALALLILLVTPEGAWVIREKKTGKELYRRYHY